MFKSQFPVQVTDNVSVLPEMAARRAPPVWETEAENGSLDIHHMPVLVLVSHRLAGPQRQLATETETGPSEKKQKTEPVDGVPTAIFCSYSSKFIRAPATRQSQQRKRFQASASNWVAWFFWIGALHSDWSLAAHRHFPKFHFFLVCLHYGLFLVIPIPHSTLRHTFQLFWSVCLFLNPRPTVPFIHSSLFALCIKFKELPLNTKFLKIIQKVAQWCSFSSLIDSLSRPFRGKCSTFSNWRARSWLGQRVGEKTIDWCTFRSGSSFKRVAHFQLRNSRESIPITWRAFPNDDINSGKFPWKWTSPAVNKANCVIHSPTDSHHKSRPNCHTSLRTK